MWVKKYVVAISAVTLLGCGGNDQKVEAKPQPPANETASVNVTAPSYTQPNILILLADDLG